MRRPIFVVTCALALGWGDLARAQSGEVIIPEVDVEAERESEEVDEPVGPERADAVTDDDLARRQTWRLGDALDWLTSATKVDSTGTGSGLIVDGLPAAQLQVTEDGLPVSRPVGGPDGPAVNLDNVGLAGRGVERVELHRGMGPPGSGPASGVVVEVHRAELDPGLGVALQTATRTAALRPLDTFPLLALGAGRATYGGDQFDLQLRGNFDRSDGVDVNGDGQLDSPDGRDFGVGARSVWRPTEDAEGALVFDLSYTDGVTEGAIGPMSVLRDVVDTRQVVGRVLGEWRSSSGLSVEHKSQFDVYGHQFSKRVLDGGFERLKADTGQLRFVQDVLAQQAFGRHLLGVETYGSVERIERTGETGELPTVERLHGGIGLSDTWMPTDSVEVAGRLWGDVHTDFEPGWMADVGAGWQVADAVELRASASRTRRLPTAEELFLFFDHSEIGYKVSGNPDLSPEKLWSGRIGVRLQPVDDKLQFDAEAYYHRLDDLITTAQLADSTGAIPTFTYTNIASAHTAGGRLSLGVRELFWGVDARASYSYLPLAEDLDTGERLELRTHHQVLVELKRDWLDERLQTWVDARSRTALSVSAGSPEAPAYLLLGAGVGWQPSDSFLVRLDADNLLDQTNATWGPKMGVSVLASVEYHFQSTGDGR